MVAFTLATYLDELRNLPTEKPLEPELKAEQQKQDVKIREEQDLNAGAVLQAEVQAGEGDASPAAGDLVYVHVTVRTEDDDIVYSTRSEHGGNGQALAFVLEKGKRAPRGWEIVLKGMHKGQVCMLKIKPSYGYRHPDCSMEPPSSVPADEPLSFEMQLLEWYPAARVRVLPLANGMYRRTVKDGTGWESPRPPFEVLFNVKACCPAYDGMQMTGFKYFTNFDDGPVKALMGSGQLPPGLEVALGSMTQGERAIFVVPAEDMKPATSGAGGRDALPSLLPSPPAAAAQVEVEVELHGLVQVRDMVGDGSVVKRRMRQGNGEFPIDCPIEDTTVWLHYRVRRLDVQPQELLQQSTGGDTAWVLDSRTQGQKGDGEAAALEVDTGCGDLPEALEMCVKLMVPGELARVAAHARYAYEDRSDCPPGIQPTDTVEFEVELSKFVREGHWQNLSMGERFAIAEKMKAKGNELFKTKRYKYARARYERLLRMLDSTRDFERQEDVDKIDEYKLAMVSNLTLCCYHQADYVQAVAYASKGLEHNPDSAKLLLRRARALSMKGNYDEAEEDLKTCQGLVQSRSEAAALAQEVEQELLANRRRAKAAETKQKKTFANFFDR